MKFFLQRIFPRIINTFKLKLKNINKPKIHQPIQQYQSIKIYIKIPKKRYITITPNLSTIPPTHPPNPTLDSQLQKKKSKKQTTHSNFNKTK